MTKPKRKTEWQTPPPLVRDKRDMPEEALKADELWLRGQFKASKSAQCMQCKRTHCYGCEWHYKKEVRNFGR